MNLRHFYYRTYFEGLGNDFYDKILDGSAKKDENLAGRLAQKNHKLLGYRATEEAVGLISHQKNGVSVFRDRADGDDTDFREIMLQTAGQGLLTGTGYAHETGSMGELKLGFYFDPTTGLPMLPGHSVKGALRAVFPSKTDRDNIKTGKAKWIIEQLPEAARPPVEMDALAFVEKLAAAIFDTDEKTPIARRDIFLDAAMTEHGRTFLGRDALAPHDRKTHGLKNPVPIPFLKVLPGVVFRFSFLLKPSTIDDVSVDKDAKRQLFEAILIQFGAGAKTRGGYGVFEKAKKKAVEKPKPGEGLLDKIEMERFKKSPISGLETYEAMAMGVNEKGKTIFILFVGMPGVGARHVQKWPTELAVGDILKVKVRLAGNGGIQEIYLA